MDRRTFLKAIGTTIILTWIVFCAILVIKREIQLNRAEEQRFKEASIVLDKIKRGEL